MRLNAQDCTSPAELPHSDHYDSRLARRSHLDAAYAVDALAGHGEPAAAAGAGRRLRLGAAGRSRRAGADAGRTGGARRHLTGQARERAKR